MHFNLFDASKSLFSFGPYNWRMTYAISQSLLRTQSSSYAETEIGWWSNYIEQPLLLRPQWPLECLRKFKFSFYVDHFLAVPLAPFLMQIFQSTAVHPPTLILESSLKKYKTLFANLSNLLKSFACVVAAISLRKLRCLTIWSIRVI